MVNYHVHRESAWKTAEVAVNIFHKVALSCVAILVLSFDSGAFAQNSPNRYITFQNNCRWAVRLWVYHADGWRNWHPHGPFELSAYSGPTRLLAGNTYLTQSDGHNLYYYAETLGRTRTWDGNQQVAYNGITYNMRLAEVGIQNGNLGHVMNCA